MIAGLAVTRTVIYRHRLGLMFVAAYVALVSTCLLTLDKDRSPTIFALLILGLFVTAFYMIAVFIHPDSDVASAGSTYPSHYFTLPVKTRDLVLWPVAASVLVMGGTTWALGFMIQRAGISFDPVGAAAFVVGLTTVLQAIFWYPFGIPYAKLVLTLAAIVGLFVLAFSTELLGFGLGAKIGIYLAITAGAVATTLAGVGRARSGEFCQRSAKPAEEVVPKGELKVLKPFRSAAAAQFWYEWRQQGKTLPILALLISLLFLVPLYWNDTLSPLDALASDTASVVPTVPTYLKTFFPMLIGLMAMYGWAVGCGAKKTDLRKGDRTFQLFFGTRPMSDAGLVWTKLKIAAASTLLAWGLLLAVLLPLLLMKGGYVDRNQGMPVSLDKPLFLTLAPYLTWDVWSMVLACLAIAMFFTWRNYVIGYWTELSGSLFLRYAQPALSACIYVAFASSPRQNWVEWLPYALGAALALKLCLAAWVAIHELRTGLLRVKPFLVVLGTYLLAVFVVGEAVLRVTVTMRDPRYIEPQMHLALLWCIGLGIFLCVPLARILLAVSSLSENRHR